MLAHIGRPELADAGLVLRMGMIATYLREAEKE